MKEGEQNPSPCNNIQVLVKPRPRTTGSDELVQEDPEEPETNWYKCSGPILCFSAGSSED